MASLGGDSATSTEDGRMRYRLEKVGYYSIGKTIGRGNFADVKLARHEISKCKVAIKIVDRSKVDSDNLAKIDREIRILKSLQHPHIIKLFQILKTDRYLYIVTEYAGGGELFELLVEKGKMSETEGRRLFQQATSAVAYCHSMGVVHRDLKAENLLIDKHDNVKLIDFGFSNFQSPNQLLATWCGSPPYAAPELFIGREYDGTKADIWSLGVVLYILVSGGFPFPGSSMDKLKRAVLSGQVKIPYWVSVECADLIRKMLVVNPAKRYSVHQVVQHRWFTANMTNKVETLIEESLNPTTPTDVQPVAPLNGTVMLFLQQHTGWTDDRVTQAIIEKDFESSLYATYNMLCYKLARHYKDNHIPTGHDTSRRGSRGSILSGKANVDIPDQAPQIPAHDLAKLNLSTSPELDSEDGDSSNSDAAEELPRTSRVSMRLLRAQYTSMAAAAAATAAAAAAAAAAQNSQQQSLQDPSLRPLAFPPEALAYLQSTGRPRGSLDAQAMAGVAMLRRQNLLPTTAGLDPAAALLAMPTYLMNDVPGVQPSPELSQLPQVGLTPMWPCQPPVMGFYQTPSGPFLHLPDAGYPMNLRRSSDGSAPFATALNPMEAFACSSMAADPGGAIGPLPTATAAPPLTVEEEGARYLRYCGGKRNTFHGSLTPPNLHGPYLTPPGTSGASRHGRSPYQVHKNGPTFSERRSSWTSTTTPLTSQQHWNLDQIYHQHLQKKHDNASASIGVQQLQREFQQLRANTESQTFSPSRSGASPSPPSMSQQQGGVGPMGQSASMLDMIAEQEVMDQGGPPPTLPSGHMTPRISITDENNRSLLEPQTPTSTSASFDPVSIFQQQAQQILSGQRPSTSASFSMTPSSGASSPDHQYYYASIPVTPDRNGKLGKSILSSLNIGRVVEQLKRVLDGKRINYQEQMTSRNDNSDMEGGGSDSSRRLSLESDDGTKVEIDVSSLLRRQEAPYRSKVDFLCVEGDIQRYDRLCTELISELQM